MNDRDRANALMGDLAEVMHYTAWRKMRDSIAQALVDARVEVLHQVANHSQALREENRVKCSVCEGDPLGFVCLRCDSAAKVKRIEKLVDEYDRQRWCELTVGDVLDALEGDFR